MPTSAETSPAWRANSFARAASIPPAAALTFLRSSRTPGKSRSFACTNPPSGWPPNCPNPAASVEFLLQHRQSLKQDVTHTRETARVNFVQGVLRSVPICRRDVEIDDVAPRHAAPDEREVIVKGGDCAFVDKDIPITKSCSGRPDEVRKPRRRVGVPLDL